MTARHRPGIAHVQDEGRKRVLATSHHTIVQQRHVAAAVTLLDIQSRRFQSPRSLEGINEATRGQAARHHAAFAARFFGDTLSSRDTDHATAQAQHVLSTAGSATRQAPREGGVAFLLDFRKDEAWAA